MSKKSDWIRDVAMHWQSDECLRFPFVANPTGYARLMYQSKNIYAHQLVCIWTHGPRPSPNHDASHSCGNGHLACVSPRHVRWKTKSDNQREAWAHDRRKGRRYKLTRAQASEIVLLRGSEPPHITAARYGVNERAIRKIQSGEGWNNFGRN